MKNIIWGFALCFGLVFSANAAGLKIAVVSVDGLMKNAPQVTTINNKMKERFAAPQKDLQDLGAKIQDAQGKLKKSELVLTKQQKTDEQKKILEMIKTFRDKEMELKREVETVRSQALAEFRFTVQSVLSDLAKEKGYDLILSEGVAFAKDKFNITEQVLERLRDKSKEGAK